MGLTIAALVLLSACLHPLWNTLIKKGENQRTGFLALTLGMITIAFGHSLLSGFDLFAAFEAWDLVIFSWIGQMCYGSGLVAVLRRGDLSAYYPIIRSTPLIVIAFNFLVLGQSYDLLVILFVLLVLFAAFMLQYRRGHRLFDDPVTLGFALLSLLGTGIYTLADATAMQVLEPSVLNFWVNLFCFPSYCLLYWLIDRDNAGVRTVKAFIARPVHYFMIGAICYSSYFLILYVYSEGADVAAVATVRQASIPISVLIGGLYFREGAVLRRLVASLFLAMGIVGIILNG
ncbi:hypothetical protein O4H49_09860 [Kiloniella laminariae]|uniref:EamA domain-containing protein n=1 Tax=Kiloniella laminariae TaxID=454162 RepID=A0ABT4LM87_9PROT|nr:hypothetical protein [Kiloniella laminariae]MCZ4281082.1 hypothetical protein [Kiloniella laminariae]